MNSSRYLVKRARILDQHSPHHQQVLDIVLENGHIVNIGANLEDANAERIEIENLHLSLGFIEMRANFNDPGNEDREDIDCGAHAAANGGYTAVALSPQTQPSVDHKSAVEYLVGRSQNTPVHLLPIGSFSKELKGQNLSEMADMQASGAIAFSHGTKAVGNTALMKLALLYNRELRAPLQVLAYDEAMVQGGQMHEGPKSTWLGLKGLPALAERIGVARDLALADYTDAAIHFQGISSKDALTAIAEAKEKGQRLSADVNWLNLIKTDADLESYDSHLKVYPPLRDEAHRQALIKALQTGLLSAIAGDHRPRTIEEKRCEFDLAAFGAASLEISFAALHTHLKNELGLELLVERLSRGPRNILNYQKEVKIEKGAAVDLSFFNPELKWTWDASQGRSKAANYPIQKEEFTAKVVGTYCKGVWRSNSL